MHKRIDELPPLDNRWRPKADQRNDDCGRSTHGRRCGRTGNETTTTAADQRTRQEWVEMRQGGEADTKNNHIKGGDTGKKRRLRWTGFFCNNINNIYRIFKII